MTKAEKLSLGNNADSTETHAPKRRVVCAALRLGSDVICGPRHYDPTMRSVIRMVQPMGDIAWRSAEQGFVDQYGIFLTREKARTIAKRSGQIIRRCGGDAKKLFSENLY